MRRYFPRALWLCAWSFWAWLGWGLYRELPRSPTPFAELPFEDEHERWGPEERPLGFTNGDALLVTQRWQPNADGAGETRCTVWDIRARRRLHDLNWPLLWTQEIIAPAQGVAIGNCRGEGPGDGALTLFDFRTAQRRPLGPSYWRVEAVHPSHPWAAIRVRRESDAPEQVLVIDFRSDERLFEWSEPDADADNTHVQGCQFLGGDELLITASHLFDAPSTRVRWDLYEFSLKRGELARLSFDCDLRCGVHLPMHRGHFLLISLPGDGLEIEVLEFPSGRALFSSAALATGPASKTDTEWRSIPTLSPSGRRLMTNRGTLWDVDAARPVWSTHPKIDISVERDPSAEVFSVHEDWQPLLDLVGIPEGWYPSASAVRDIETGSLRWRTWRSDPLVRISADGRWGANSYGCVYTLPPRANYALLALCQAILALPLMLVWAVLRWRQKRRLASVEAPLSADGLPER